MLPQHQTKPCSAACRLRTSMMPLGIRRRTSSVHACACFAHIYVCFCRVCCLPSPHTPIHKGIHKGGRPPKAAAPLCGGEAKRRLLSGGGISALRLVRSVRPCAMLAKSVFVLKTKVLCPAAASGIFFRPVVAVQPWCRCPRRLCPAQNLAKVGILSKKLKFGKFSEWACL